MASSQQQHATISICNQYFRSLLSLGDDELNPENKKFNMESASGHRGLLTRVQNIKAELLKQFTIPD